MARSHGRLAVATRTPSSRQRCHTTFTATVANQPDGREGARQPLLVSRQRSASPYLDEGELSVRSLYEVCGRASKTSAQLRFCRQQCWCTPSHTVRSSLRYCTTVSAGDPDDRTLSAVSSRPVDLHTCRGGKGARAFPGATAFFTSPLADITTPSTSARLPACWRSSELMERLVAEEGGRGSG